MYLWLKVMRRFSLTCRLGPARTCICSVNTQRNILSSHRLPGPRPRCFPKLVFLVERSERKVWNGLRSYTYMIWGRPPNTVMRLHVFPPFIWPRFKYDAGCRTLIGKPENPTLAGLFRWLVPDVTFVGFLMEIKKHIKAVRPCLKVPRLRLLT
jgi:hypothetical protein